MLKLVFAFVMTKNGKTILCLTCREKDFFFYPKDKYFGKILNNIILLKRKLKCIIEEEFT